MMKAPRSIGAFSFTFAFMAFAFSIAIALDSFTTLSTWTARTGQATRVTTGGATGKGSFWFLKGNQEKFGFGRRGHGKIWKKIYYRNRNSHYLEFIWFPLFFCEGFPSHPTEVFRLMWSRDSQKACFSFASSAWAIVFVGMWVLGYSRVIIYSISSENLFGIPQPIQKTKSSKSDELLFITTSPVFFVYSFIYSLIVTPRIPGRDIQKKKNLRSSLIWMTKFSRSDLLPGISTPSPRTIFQKDNLR